VFRSSRTEILALIGLDDSLRSPRRNLFIKDTILTTLQQVDWNLMLAHVKEPTDCLLYSMAASIDVEEISVLTLMSRDLSF
jgi:hypothetical protein